MTEYRMVDTTLRDGEQSPGFAFNILEKVRIAKLLDRAGIYQIEGGVPAMGKAEQEALLEMKSSCHFSKISAWNRLLLTDIQASLECKPDIMHISAPVSSEQICRKLGKNKEWLKQELRTCVSFARERNFVVTVGFEDASRAEMPFLLELAGLLEQAGVSYIRFADTLGIMSPFEVYDTIKTFREFSGIDLEFHAHNDFGMAVVNSFAAVQAGARYVDTTLHGIGERAGNCSLLTFLEMSEGCLTGKVKKSQAKWAEKESAAILWPERKYKNA